MTIKIINVEIEKRIHIAYEECLMAKKRGIKIPVLVGKYQYIYKTKNGEISLVKFTKYMKIDGFWEIYELSDNYLFEDTERFKTKTEAVKRIKELLEK